MKTFLEYISFITKSQEIILSVDCFIKDNGIATNPLFVKMILACLLPLGMIILIALFWGIAALMKKIPNISKNLLHSIAVLIFVTLPAITSVTFEIFNCNDIFNNGSSYLAADMSV